jgi:hypothetical protein
MVWDLTDGLRPHWWFEISPLQECLLQDPLGSDQHLVMRLCKTPSFKRKGHKQHTRQSTCPGALVRLESNPHTPATPLVRPRAASRATTPAASRAATRALCSITCSNTCRNMCSNEQHVQHRVQLHMQYLVQLHMQDHVQQHVQQHKHDHMYFYVQHLTALVSLVWFNILHLQSNDDLKRSVIMICGAYVDSHIELCRLHCNVILSTQKGVVVRKSKPLNRPI